MRCYRLDEGEKHQNSLAAAVSDLGDVTRGMSTKIEGAVCSHADHMKALHNEVNREVASAVGQWLDRVSQLESFHSAIQLENQDLRLRVQRLEAQLKEKETEKNKKEDIIMEKNEKEAEKNNQDISESPFKRRKLSAEQTELLRKKNDHTQQGYLPYYWRSGRRDGMRGCGWH